MTNTPKLTTKQKLHIASAIFSSIGLYLFIANISMVFLDIGLYTPPLYSSLHSDSGVVIENTSSAREIRRNGIPLTIKNNKIISQYSCSFFGNQTCLIGFTAKSLSGSVFGINVEVKWHEYRNRKIIYEIKIDNKVVESYERASNLYRNEINNILLASKVAKNNLIYGVILFFIGIAFVIFSKTR